MAKRGSKNCVRRFPNESSHLFSEIFLQESSLHGLKYIARKNANFCERAFWMFAFALSVFLSLYFVSNMWLLFESNPLVLTIETTNEPVRNLRFPAVTVCSTQQIIWSKLRALYNQLRRNLSVKIEELFEASRMELEFDETERPVFHPFPFENLFTLDSYFRNGSLSYLEVMKSVSPNCGDMIRHCKWRSNTNCTADLVRLLTPMGYCCAFNFPESAAHDANKFRSLYKGKGFGLELVIDAKNSHESNETFGHKVLLHDRNTYPYRPAFDLQVGPGELLNIGLDPVFIQSSDDIRIVPLAKRDCDLPDEYQLTLNLTHSYKNCITECFSIHQLKQCGCVRSYIQAYNRNATACLIRDINCVKAVLNNVSEHLVEMCDCRPPCEEIIYNYLYSHRNITFRELSYVMNRFGPTTFENYSMVRVFFKESRFTKYKRSVRYHWEDFLANAGGLLGVGFGFSFLSAVELAYFFCYKFWKPLDGKKAKQYKEFWAKKNRISVNQNYQKRKSPRKPTCHPNYFG